MLCTVVENISAISRRSDHRLLSAPSAVPFPSGRRVPEHLDSVIRTLLTWDKTENQIIVASIEGKETANSIPGVNIILLENPQNHLFSKEEYGSYE